MLIHKPVRRASFEWLPWNRSSWRIGIPPVASLFTSTGCHKTYVDGVLLSGWCMDRILYTTGYGRKRSSMPFDPEPLASHVLHILPRGSSSSASPHLTIRCSSRITDYIQCFESSHESGVTCAYTDMKTTDAPGSLLNPIG